MKTKQTIALLVALFALHVGVRAQDTSVVYGTPFHIVGGAAQGGTGIVYQWQCNGDSIEGATDPDYTTLATLKPGMYTYARKSRCAECNGRWQFSNPHTVEVKCPAASTLNAGDITGTSSALCAGVEYTYSVTAEANTVYQWAFPAGWGQTLGGNSNSIKVKPSTTIGSISVMPTDTVSGCVGTASTLAIATINTQPTLTLITNNDTSQRVFANRAIAAIKYARTGSVTTNTFAWSPSTPAGITATNGTDSIKGTPTTAETYNYTLTVTATGCSDATATGKIVVSAACVEGTNYQYRNGKCYSAKGGVAYSTGSNANCASWFGAGYKIASASDAQYITCPLYGVCNVFTGSTYYFASSVPTTYHDDVCATLNTNASGTGTKPLGYGLGRTPTAWTMAQMTDTGRTHASAGHLCVREP